MGVIDMGNGEVNISIKELKQICSDITVKTKRENDSFYFFSYWILALLLQQVHKQTISVYHNLSFFVKQPMCFCSPI